MYAATLDFGETESLRVLLAEGVDRALKNDEGRTALQQARGLNHRALAGELQK